MGLLDVATGQAEALPGASEVWTAAFAPNGAELAVQHSLAAGGALKVLSLDGGADRVLDLPRGHLLDGPTAWSPDGALLATSRAPMGCGLEPFESEAEWLSCRQEYDTIPDEVFFVDATGQNGRVPDPLGRAVATGEDRILGWTATDRVLVLAGTDNPDPYWLTEVPLDGSPPRRLSAIPTADANYGVGRFQLATALLPGLQVRRAADADRGRWPVVARIGFDSRAPTRHQAVINWRGSDVEAVLRPHSVAARARLPAGDGVAGTRPAPRFVARNDAAPA